jgi:hypothetical protein
MKYLLNSAVITAPGNYSYRLLTKEQARAWDVDESAISAIGYEQTAAALSLLLGHPVPMNRQIISMAAGDEALVFRVVRPDFQRIDPKDKGRLSRALMEGAFEIGLLKRLPREAECGNSGT